MITYDEAMRRAIGPDPKVRDVAEATHWLAVARELREASAQPVLDRILQQAREAAPIKPNERLAVQDVQAEHCPHRVIVVRLPGATDAWWHVADRSWCHPEDPSPTRRSEVRPGDAETQTMRIVPPARPTPLVSEAATSILTLNDTRACAHAHCAEAILQNPNPGERSGRGEWLHARSGTAMCPKVADDGSYSYAWPAAQA